MFIINKVIVSIIVHNNINQYYCARAVQRVSVAAVWWLMPVSVKKHSADHSFRYIGTVLQYSTTYLPYSTPLWNRFGLCLAVFAGSGGKYLFHIIGWKGRIWQVCTMFAWLQSCVLAWRTVSFHVCFCDLDSGNLKFETVRTNKQRICF